MPSNDDFDDFENTPDADEPTAAEIEAARRLLAKVDQPSNVEDLPDVVAPQVDEDVEYASEAVAHTKSKKGNRKNRRSAGKIPDNAPKPQDHQKATAARQSEATDATIVLTLWGEEIRVDRSALIDNWDWQLGAIGKNPLHMVKGLLGDKQFFWFCARSQAEGKPPMEAASEIMTMFAEEAGMVNEGNS
ncbi:hypothetical protein R3Q06_17955 [Rhodococcus erythropolis]|uniref:hypothetical protein n=1 Tax=Rhodococcus erythropolis TaxID=1833 RepID=UPI00294A881C|nr:hypothetical protein [Rhodococcus erythropolis]MDV6275382.1 hypothetical protein [Rhodococcus erythropolis]